MISATRTAVPMPKSISTNYRLAPALSPPWQPVGELERPSASETEFGTEVVCNERWPAAGSPGSTYGQTSLTPRVRLVPRSGHEEWMDGHLVNMVRAPAQDAGGEMTRPTFWNTPSICIPWKQMPSRPPNRGAAILPACRSCYRVGLTASPA